MSIRVHLSLFVLAIGLMLTGCDTANEDPQVVELPLPQSIAEEDYTVTATGLKYYDLVVGDTTFMVAEEGQQVAVHYNGWLESGLMFDSSIYFGGTPIVFFLGSGQVIPGFDEGILGMYPGGERQLVIPPELAYDSLGTNNVPPNSTVIFEVSYLGFLE